MFLSFIGKEISGTIIFSIFIKETSPSHNRFSRLFTHEGRLVTSNMFFLYMGMNIEDFRGNVFKFFKFSRQKIFQREFLKKICSKRCIIKVVEISILNNFRFMLCLKSFLKPLKLIYGSQTNLSYKQLTNGNFSGDLSKCGH